MMIWKGQDGLQVLGDMWRGPANGRVRTTPERRPREVHSFRRDTWKGTPSGRWVLYLAVEVTVTTSMADSPSCQTIHGRPSQVQDMVHRGLTKNEASANGGRDLDDAKARLAGQGRLGSRVSPTATKCRGRLRGFRRHPRATKGGG